MSKSNPLAGLIGNYGDSDEESDDGTENSLGFRPAMASSRVGIVPPPSYIASEMSPSAIHPPPIPHCPWSACYDETSGFTYYWNQLTNAVTWEAPPEYLLALKVAQQQLHSAGSAEVSAEEWQLYQQALAEKQKSQNKLIGRTVPPKIIKKNNPVRDNNIKNNNRKRSNSDHEEEKIELITSYHNSDSDSNDEPESPVKIVKPPPTPKPPSNSPKVPHKKAKTKPQIMEYGPTLPPNQNYSAPIGPEILSQLTNDKSKLPDRKVDVAVKKDEDKKSTKSENEDGQDENTLLIQLKDKAKLLEKLGGEIPTDLQKIIEDETRSRTASPAKVIEDDKISEIDDLLDEIEKKVLPKVVNSKKIDMFENANKPNDGDSAINSPRSTGTPPTDIKPLFPSSQNIEEPVNTLSPNAVKIEENEIAKDEVTELPVTEKKNVYLMDENEHLEKPTRKKLRISNSVLPERKKTETPAYTTKYSQYIEGFSSERTGLGFSKEEDGNGSPKNTVSYGNGLTFTKGETLNDENNEDDEEDLDDLMDLVEAKLKYLNQLQPCQLTPVQEMLIQMQTLAAAAARGALCGAYARRWARGAARALRRREAAAAPAGWTCAFLRSEGRYRYRREADGLVQWEYPAAANMDMEICTTPPHPGVEGKEEPPAPPPPVPVVPPPSPPPPPPPPPARVATPPPPAWADPPPPGCDDPLPLPSQESKQEIGDELLSFYNDIAELEKESSAPHTAPSSPEAPPPPEIKPKDTDKDKDKEKDAKINRKKTKVKISTSMGLKHKTVSNLVAKWKQVADEINSD